MLVAAVHSILVGWCGGCRCFIAERATPEDSQTELCPSILAEYSSQSPVRQRMIELAPESRLPNLQGALHPEFLALGLGGTNMMAMLWSVAMGRRAVGVEMRGDPFLGVHWNIREDLYHQLGLIDEMMLDRYGRDGVPNRGDGRLFSLAECFYSLETKAGDIVPDNVIDGYDAEQHIAGTIHHVEFIDDRWTDGVPNRVLTLLRAPAPPDAPDADKIRTNIVDVLDGPSTFQASAASILILLRRYLEGIERLDLARGLAQPRVRLFTRHRVIPQAEDGFVSLPDGRKAVRIEALQELDYRGKFVRVRAPGTQPIDLGVPELFMVAQGVRSSDAKRLGFEQKPVEVDHGDGRGPVVAQADYLAGLMEVLVDGRLRRRISSEFDEEGREYWVRQIAVGHENDPEVGWVLVQVPDHLTFDPVKAGLASPETDPDSPEFFAAYQALLYDYYLTQCSEVLEIPKRELKRIQMVYGPKLFSLVEVVGDDAQIAKNGVVAGDSFGNGHFLTSGGAMTGMVAHGARVLEYWRSRDRGVTPEEAIRPLADGIKEDTHGWLEVSAKEYSEALPINFGAERIRDLANQTSLGEGVRAHAVDASRRRRHSLLPLDPSDWRRLFLRNGKVRSAPLPDLHPMHPALRGPGAAQAKSVAVVYVVPTFDREGVAYLRTLLAQVGARIGLIHEEGLELLPESVRFRLAAHHQVSDAHNPLELARAIQGMTRVLGRPDVLLGTLPDLEVPLGQTREALGLSGTGGQVAENFSDVARTRRLLQEAGILVGGDEVAVEEEFSLEVMTLRGIPAWSSATRMRFVAEAPGSSRSKPLSVVLPRELDDPADSMVRRMGFAALRALGMKSGLSHMKWVRRADGKAAVVHVAPTPPPGRRLSLMGHAHGANMAQVWAKSVVRGHFAPIPRRFAAGIAYLHGVGGGNQVVDVSGFAKLRQDLGEMIVELDIPELGQPRRSSEADGLVVLRHQETRQVEQALEHVHASLRILLSEAS